MPQSSNNVISARHMADHLQALCNASYSAGHMPCRYPYYSELYVVTMEQTPKKVQSTDSRSATVYIAARIDRISRQACLPSSTLFFSNNMDLHALTTLSNYLYLFNDNTIPYNMQQALLYSVTANPRYVLPLLKHRKAGTFMRTDEVIGLYRTRVEHLHNSSVAAIHRPLNVSERLRAQVYFEHNCQEYCSKVHIYTTSALDAKLQYIQHEDCVKYGELSEVRSLLTNVAYISPAHTGAMLERAQQIDNKTHNAYISAEAKTMLLMQVYLLLFMSCGLYAYFGKCTNMIKNAYKSITKQK